MDRCRPLLLRIMSSMTLHRQAGPIVLGTEYTDSITGFTGIATGRCEYLTGCNQVSLQPKVGEDGKRKDSEWFDEERLTQDGVFAVTTAPKGGPQDTPPNR